MRRFAILLACLALAGCGDPVAELNAATSRLPPGCTLTELGPYRDGWLVAVHCDGRVATAISWSRSTTHCTSTGKSVICSTDYDRTTTVEL